MRRVGKVHQLSPQADAPSAVAAAMHDVEECLVANLVEIQRAAADGVASKTLQTMLVPPPLHLAVPTARHHRGVWITVGH